MIHFDSSKLAEAFSNGGIYVHSDPYLGYRFVDGKVAEGVFTIDYLAPVEFRKDGATNTISFESIVDPEFAGMARVMPEGTDSFKDYRTYGSFRYTDHASAELLNMSYGEKYYTYGTQSGDAQPFVGQLTKLGNCAVAKNGFSILAGPANGVVAFGDNTVVFQVPIQGAQVLDVVLYPPQHMSAPKSDAQPVIIGNNMGVQSTEDDADRTSGSEHGAKASAESTAVPSPVEMPAPKDVPQEHVSVPERQLRTPESGSNAGAPEDGAIQRPVPSGVNEVPSSNVVDSGSESAKDKLQDSNDQMPEELHDAEEPRYLGIIGWLKSIFS
ncbi:hypothetical protein [Anaplasma centrale]|nr:hypothetical protein [Anaplasma centrale]